MKTKPLFLAAAVYFLIKLFFRWLETNEEAHLWRIIASLFYLVDRKLPPVERRLRLYIEDLDHPIARNPGPPGAG
jgi:hypothetical protein